jgi:hypothetical protein
MRRSYTARPMVPIGALRPFGQPWLGSQKSQITTAYLATQTPSRSGRKNSPLGVAGNLDTGPGQGEYEPMEQDWRRTDGCETTRSFHRSQCENLRVDVAPGSRNHHNIRGGRNGTRFPTAWSRT